MRVKYCSKTVPIRKEEYIYLYQMNLKEFPYFIGNSQLFVSEYLDRNLLHFVVYDDFVATKYIVKSI